MVPVTCPQLETAEFLMEPLSSEDGQLPEGLLVSPTLVVAKKGFLHAPVFNVGCSEVWLSPRRAVGTVQVVRATPVSTMSVIVEPAWEECSAIVSMQEVISGPDVQLPALPDFEGLSPQQRSRAKALFAKYDHIFSKGDGDLGCTSLIAHEIPLIDNTPVRQPYRRIPPSQYETVKEHIQQVLQSQVIRESCSPYSSPIVLVTKKDGTPSLRRLQTVEFQNTP